MLAETTPTTVSTITTKASTTTTTASEAVTGNLVYSNLISNGTFITKKCDELSEYHYET